VEQGKKAAKRGKKGLRNLHVQLAFIGGTRKKGVGVRALSGLWKVFTGKRLGLVRNHGKTSSLVSRGRAKGKD